MKLKFIFILVALVFLVMSCSDDDKWDKTADGTLTLQKSEDQGHDDYHLEINKIEARIKSLTLRGTRLQAESVEIEISKENILDFINGTTSNVVNFEIPQGTYTKIFLDIQLEDSNDGGIELGGGYKNNQNESQSFRINISKSKEINLVGEDDDGSNDFLIIENQSYKIQLSLNLKKLFKNIPHIAWNNMVPDVASDDVEISSTSNPELYWSIKEELEGAFELTVK